MYTFVLIVHVLLALFMIVIILLQGGRGGLGEALGGAAAQSLFGGSANTVMTKLTAVCAGLFMITSVTLSLLSTARGRSVIEQGPMSEQQLPLALPQAPEEPEAQPLNLSVPNTEPLSTTPPAGTTQ